MLIKYLIHLLVCHHKTSEIVSSTWIDLFLILKKKKKTKTHQPPPQTESLFRVKSNN